MLYRPLFDHVLTRLDAEVVHTWTVRALALLERFPAALALVRAVVGRPDPSLAVRAMGIDFPGPLGLAAGFDKDAEVPDAMAAFGFDFVEVGTVTAEPQPGNPRPRLHRLPRDRALINRMGFNNHGAHAAAVRLSRRRRRPAHDAVGGANIGTSTVTPADAAAEDYATSARLLAPHADYLVVNVSSPNTPGLRDLQAVDALRPVLTAVLDARAASGASPPVLVKIAPDLADDDVDAVADLAVELGLDGLIATNTTIAREGLATAPAEVAAAGAGGLSGEPLRERSLQLLERLHARVGDRLVLISAGGVASADDVWDRLAAGATLVQAYTGMVYGGPAFAARVHAGLRRRLEAEGYVSIGQVRTRSRD